MKSLTLWIGVFREWLQYPLRVLLVTGLLTFFLVLFDGTLFRLWSLSRDTAELSQRIEDIKMSTQEKTAKLQESSQADFIEREVREQLDLVRDGDLVFIFSDASPVSGPEYSSAKRRLKKTSSPTKASR